LKIADQIWQEQFSCWQSRFIHQNFLLIGYRAWQGYLEAGAGIVVCNLLETIPPNWDWKMNSIPFNLTFVPATEATKYCQTIGLRPCLANALPKEARSVLQSAIERSSLAEPIADYEPNQEIILLLRGNGELSVNRLQNLRVAPAACYEQVQRRWAEFQPQAND